MEHTPLMELMSAYQLANIPLKLLNRAFSYFVMLNVNEADRACLLKTSTQCPGQQLALMIYHLGFQYLSLGQGSDLWLLSPAEAR